MDFLIFLGTCRIINRPKTTKNAEIRHKKTMNWFYIALISPIAHSFVNHLDKYLLSKYLKGGSVGTLVLFSALFSVLALPVILVIQPEAISSVSFYQGFLLCLNGAFLVTAIICYLYALETDEATYVAPLFQLIPVFSLILGYVFLGEVLTISQLLAMCIIVAGGVLISLEFGTGKINLRSKTLGLMLLASGLYAINLILFKMIAGEQGFVNSLFWDLLGKVIFGIILYFTVGSYRKQFNNLIKSNSAKVFGLNGFNEILALIGEVAIIYAALFAPVALVQSVSSTQPLFVFIVGIILTLYFPKIAQENINRRILIQKIAATVVIVIGAAMLNFV